MHARERNTPLKRGSDKSRTFEEERGGEERGFVFGVWCFCF